MMGPGRHFGCRRRIDDSTPPRSLSQLSPASSPVSILSTHIQNGPWTRRTCQGKSPSNSKTITTIYRHPTDGDSPTYMRISVTPLSLLLTSPPQSHRRWYRRLASIDHLGRTPLLTSEIRWRCDGLLCTSNWSWSACLVW
jgi:hypothetical protein